MAEAHVQTTFVTKQEQYAVPSYPISIPVALDPDGLTGLVNKLRGDADSTVKFSFLLDGELILETLGEILEEKKKSLEELVEIEYVEQLPPPKPETSITLDDWVSAIDANDQFILAGCYDNTTRIVQMDGTAAAVIPCHLSSLTSVCWVPAEDAGDSLHFLTGSTDQSIRLWQWQPGSREAQCLCDCRGHQKAVWSIALDPSSSQFVSGSQDTMLKLWSAVPSGPEDTVKVEEEEEEEQNPKKKKRRDGPRVPKRVPIVTLSGHTQAVQAVAWMDDTHVCSASEDWTLRFWDMAAARQTHFLQGPKVFYSISYSPLNGTVVAGHADRHVRLYDPRVKDGNIVQTVFTSHKLMVRAVHWSPSNQFQFISGSEDGLVKLWDTRSPKAPLYDLSGHTDRVLAVNWSNPKFLLSGGVDKSLKMFSYADYQQS